MQTKRAAFAFQGCSSPLAQCIQAEIHRLIKCDGIQRALAQHQRKGHDDSPLGHTLIFIAFLEVGTCKPCGVQGRALARAYAHARSSQYCGEFILCRCPLHSLHSLHYQRPLTTQDVATLAVRICGSTTTSPFADYTCTIRHPSPAMECSWSACGHRKTNHVAWPSCVAEITAPPLVVPMRTVTLYVALLSAGFVYT